MKALIHQLLRNFGFEVVHTTRDPLLQEMLNQHRTLRLTPVDDVAWCNLPPKIADLAALRRLLLLESIDLVIDVGANEGQFALHLRELGYCGDIVSFEPADEARARLRKHASGDPRWKVRPEALGRGASIASLRILANDVFTSLHPTSPAAHGIFGEAVREVGTQTVSVAALDSLWLELTGGATRRVLLKIDTQGHDAEVLAGATQALASTRVLLTEGTVIPLYADAPRFTDLIVQAESAGFVLAGLYPLAHRPTDQALLELDCLFTRPCV